MLRVLTQAEIDAEKNYYFTDAIPKAQVDSIPVENVARWLTRNGWKEESSQYGRHFSRGSRTVSFFVTTARGAGMNVAGAVQPVMDEHDMRIDEVLAAFRVG